MNVFDLFAKLSLDSSEYEKGLGEAESKGAKFGAGLKAGAGVAAGAIAATTAATVAGAKAFVSGVADVASYGDNIDKMSQKMNLSATAFQEWDFVMQHAGTSISSMQASIKTLSSAAETGKDSFEKLGITQEQIASMSGEELFGATIEALQGVEDETQRTYLAGQLLGRGASELGPLFNMSAEEVAAMKQEAHELGGVLSDETVKDAAHFQDSLQNVQTALTGAKNSMLSDFLPAFSTTMDGLSKIFSGSDVEGGLSMIEEGVKGLADGLVQKAPEVFQIGGAILQALLSSITDNLPVLLEAGIPVIMELATGIIQNLPQIISAAVSLIGAVVTGIQQNLPSILQAAQKVILTLAQAIAQNAPEIVPTIVSLILTIVTTLTDPSVLVPLIQAGNDILLGLIQGILTAIPMIAEQLPVVIDNIIQTLLQGLPLMLEAGVQIFNALIEALPIILDSLMTALPQLINSILQLILDGLPIILQGAITLFMAIIKALPTIIKALTQNVPQIITTIVSTLLQNLPQILTGAVTLFMEIIKAIPQIVAELGTQMPQIISAIVTGLGQGVSQVFQVGAELIQGLWKGISSVKDWLMSKISGFMGGVVGGIKNFFGIKSPSRLFRDEIGKNLAYGLGEGFEDAMPDTIDDMTKSAEGAAAEIVDAMQNPLDDLNASGSLSMDGYTMRSPGGLGTNLAGVNAALLDGINSYINAKIEAIQLEANFYLAGRKIDNQIVTATNRSNMISGGR